MKEFIKSKYYEFVESIKNIDECQSIVRKTEIKLQNLEEKIQVSNRSLHFRNF